MTAPVLKVGDRVLYVPHLDHWADRNRQGDHLFEFIHHAEGPPVPTGHPRGRFQPGDVVPQGSFAICPPDSEHAAAAHQLPLGRVERRDSSGVLYTSKGHQIRPSRHLRAWDAVVRRVNSDGTCDLDIIHPNGYEVHHKPDREAVAAHAADLKALLAREEAAAEQAGLFNMAGQTSAPSMRYEIDGKPAMRDAWRVHIQSLIRDPEDLTVVPGIPYDPGQGFHTFHLPEEVA